MEELLQYDISSSSVSFDEEGLMISATKSDLVHKWKKHLSEGSSKKVPTDSLKTGYIVDVMANVRKIKTGDIKNFGKFADNF